MKKFLALLTVAVMVIGVVAIPMMTADTAQAQDAKLVPIPLELPKPMFFIGGRYFVSATATTKRRPPGWRLNIVTTGCIFPKTLA